ncbi:hypothetical protein G6F68_021663 [Rhizopus microsporus]|nr:hypothetical protein G6F68_021663 [Rhizopus microsporus]
MNSTTKEEEDKTLKLIQADFTKAREGFVPSSLRGVKLQSSGVNWSDIGGTVKALIRVIPFIHTTVH